YHFEPRELQVDAAHVQSAGFSAAAVSAELHPRPLPELDAEVTALFMGAPLAVTADANFSTKAATLHFSGAVSPAVLPPLGQRLHVDIEKYFNFASLACESGDVQLGPDWKFERLT